ncbi:DUF4974 domain-containing protein [Algoriphagus sp. AGSA1]|uniref:FecR family protein n=1 Tax=Algoriphagus sp. AGSA1 TaxID=2907213 RepID=UPI001F2A175E|nr:FecR domain-containing protein [Algoriphagus sp. AGSA1]MCE7054947.1 DUF4974 domain-containing protein [Algoriphagus sp. AGSA1]
MRLPSALLGIISRILRGKASEQEVRQFNSWYDEGLDAKWQIQDYKNRSKEQVEEELLQKIKKSAHLHSHNPVSKRDFAGWKVAACTVFLIGIGLLAVKISSSIPAEDSEPAFVTFENGYGMIKKIRLPDGSAVSLFHNTTIKVAENFSENRFIMLSGEAFFEVKKDTLHPFRVESANLTTEVLGTSFLIRNQPNQKQVVAVKTGLVKVSDQVDTFFMLTPNLRLDYAEQAGAVSTIAENDPLFLWTEDVLAFDHTSMEGMIQTLEDWYGVKITSDLKSSNTCQISGTYQNQSLESILQLIQYSIPLHYQIDGKNITLTFKNCP